MKPCPFCAEEIQEAAVVCKHCGRGLAASGKSSQSGRKWTPILGGLLVAVIGVYAVAQAASGGSSDATGAAQAFQPALPPPIVVDIASGKAIEIRAGHYHHYTFELPARSCSISGRVEGISGGGKDFEGFIMDDDNFRNWSTNHQARGIESGRVVVWSPNESVQGPGTHHLVVSNAFSTMTAKAVTIAAAATCP